MKRDVFHEEEGFSTVGMAVALLVTLSLIFSAAQVYRVNSVSADIQNVADAAALAAENEVAEFMVAVRVCDAVVLSLSLTGLTAYGLGVVALCVPPAASVGERLIELGGKIMDARDEFAEKAADGLNQMQKALPFLAAANAASVASANNASSGAEYLALAVLVPSEGEEIEIASADSVEDVELEIKDQSAELQSAAQAAEEAAQEAQETKQRAFLRDCGDNPSYCMYERAQSLSSISSADNPLFQSVDAWSFSVPLERARAYYASRLSEEKPEDSSVGECARSALRERFYRYAVIEMEKGYVHETEDSFDAYFPLLPKNTDEMRLTSLYTEKVYPVTEDEAVLVMHAWEGCPEAESAVGFGSISDMETGSYATCPSCQFDAESMGKVAAASTSIENGFEYHYVAVTQAAREYQQARTLLDPCAVSAKEKASSLLDSCKQVLAQLGGQRIEAAPPGKYGVVVLAANLKAMDSSEGFENSFVRDGGVLGARAAVSAATLLPDSSEEGRTVISSLLDGFAEDGGSAVGAARVVLDCWSSLLGAYANGQEAIGEGVEKALNELPLVSASGLGTWAADVWRSCMEDVGLEPASLDSLKPVLVNTAHVASADEGAFSACFLRVKQGVLAGSGGSGDPFSLLAGVVEESDLESAASLSGSLEVAVVEFPVGDVSIPIVIALPQFASGTADGFASGLTDALRHMQGWISGAKVWE